MKTKNLLAMIAMVLGTVVVPTMATAQVPDCSGNGPNQVGLAWSSGEFSSAPQVFTISTGTLYAFNPSGDDVRGWELALNYPASGLLYLGATLRGEAVNIGQGNNFIVGLGSPLIPDSSGATALADVQFMAMDTTQKDIFAVPASPASIPGNLALVTGPNLELVPMYPVGGEGQPLANLYGPPLDYCGGTTNQNPVAGPDQASTNEDTAVTFNILANDEDIDGSIDIASVEFLTSPSGGGSFVYNGDGTVTYSPLPDYFGVDTLNYRVADDQGAVSNAAAITVTINPVDDPPVAVPENGSTDEDVALALDLLANDYDVDNGLYPPSLQLGIPAYGGTLVNHGDGTVTFTPAPDHFGFDHFSYTIADSFGTISAAAIDTIFIASVNDAPVALADQTTIEEDTAVTFSILENDGDIDGIIDITSVEFLTSPSGDGSFVYNGDGTVTYTPLPDYFGVDTLDYRVTDNQGAVSNAAAITVIINPVDDPPVAVSENGYTDEDVALTFDLIANDYDVDNGLYPPSLQLGTPAYGGILVNHGNGTVTFTPASNHFGFDHFSYTIADSFGTISAAAIDTIFIAPVNDPPVAVAESEETQEDVALVLDLVANDYDIDSELNLESLLPEAPANGGTLINHGNGTVTYTPAPDFFGLDYFSYTIADQEGAVSTAVLDSIYIISVNDPPVALADSVTTFQDVPILVDLLANDYDVDGSLDPSSLYLTAPTQGGAVADNGDGTIIYTPLPGFYGVETCTYTVSDNLELSCEYPALIVFTVLSVQDNPPVIGFIPDQTVELGQLFPPLNLNDFVSDEQDPSTLNWQAEGWNELSVTITDNVAVVKTADPAWFGSETITFTVFDSLAQSDTTSVLFTVNSGLEMFVEILVGEEGPFYAGTVPGATDGFDPQYDRILGGEMPVLAFDQPAGMENYAYVRHLLNTISNDIATTFVDGTPYEIPFNRYRPVPLGEFCLDECVWNEETQEYDCTLDCEYPLEGGRFYSVIQVPGGPAGDLMLVDEGDSGWLLVDARAPFDALNEMDELNFSVTRINNDDIPAVFTLYFDSSIQPEDGIGLKLWDAVEGVLHDLLPALEYSYEVPAGTADTRTFTLFVGTPGASGDTDGDGVPDDVDACPGEDASFFDRDGDGCIDPVVGGRHIEYWAQGTFPLGYHIHQAGAPDITDGSDLTAIQEGFAAWSGLAGCDISVDYLGTTNDPVANAFDRINTVTFSDGEYSFPSGVIAVGLSTSFLEADYENGIRPGQIIDTDMIFNPLMDFRTDTQGPPAATYIKGVVVHEAGHMLGLSHSAVQSSTMFYVLPPDTTAVSLEMEDRLAAYSAYYQPEGLAGTSHLRGTVTSGSTGEPVSGAIVFAIAPTTGDTVACDFTLPSDGSYHFIGLPDGDYHLAIHPLDGSSTIGYLFPGNINALISGTADVLFVPEFWDAAESNNDEAEAATPVAVSAGMTSEAHFITNIDQTGPTVIAVSPVAGATDVAVDTAVLFRCNEAIDPGSLVGNFNFSLEGTGELLAGSASLLENGHTLAYVPTVNLHFSSTYLLEVGAGLKDLYGNPMGTDFSTTFTTQSQPAVALNNLSPRKGVAGSLLIINGAGFDGDAGNNVVTFGADVWTVLDAAAGQLVVQVPEEAEPSTANIQVQAFGNFSNQLSYTILPPGGEARGLETGWVDLFALPRRVEVAPDGDFVYIATDQGLSYVEVSDPTTPVLGSLPLAGGLNQLDVTPDGQIVYATSKSENALYRIGTDPVAELDNLSLGFSPQGLIVGSSGQKAFLATDFREIQIWDINETSIHFQSQVGTLYAPDPNLLGPMATDPAGNYLLALDGAGRLLVFDLTTYELIAEIQVLSDAKDVVVDPRGRRAYVTDDSGSVSVVSLLSFTKLVDIPAGGTLKGAAVDPTGSFLFAVNHQLDNLDVIDLRSDSPTYQTISTRLAQQTNPVDVALSPDGIYAYCIVQSDRRLAINTIGAGPLMQSLSRRSGPLGAKVVLAGVDFSGGTVSFNGLPAVIERAEDTALTVAVPAGATSGPVMVVGAEPGQVSNSLEFEVLENSPEGNLRLAAAIAPVIQDGLTGILGVTSNDRYAVIGGQDGFLYLLDIDPESMDFNQIIDHTEGLSGPVDDLAIAPDGLSVFAVTESSSSVDLLNINPGSASFGSRLGAVSLGGAAPRHLTVSPDGRYVLATGAASGLLHIVHWVEGTDLVVDLGDTAGSLLFHPAGEFAYVVVGQGIVSVDLNPSSPGFGSIAGSVMLEYLPYDLAFSPDGNRCYVLTGPGEGAGDRVLVTLDTSNPSVPVDAGSQTIPADTSPMAENLVLSPAGDLALLNIRDIGLVLVDLASGEIRPQPSALASGAPLGFGYSSDGARVFAAASEDGSVSTFDFNGQQRITKVWGDGQTGQATQNLGSTLRVRVTDPATGEGLAGIPVTFAIDTGAKLMSYAFNPVPATPIHPTPSVKKKLAASTRSSISSADKDGGENLDDATIISLLPYTDTGTTEGRFDDYDETCPSPAPGSPDVVYLWTADFTGSIAVDLCGSGYDTKLYVYADQVTPGSPWACNDDFYDEASGCGNFVSFIEDMYVYEGTTYIIVIDGFGGSSGPYNLSVSANYTSTPWGFLITDDPEAVPSSRTVGTGPNGFAEVRMNLGLNLGPRNVDVSCLGTDGSPLQFTETAVADPEDISFDLLESRFAPMAGSVDVAVTTAVQVAFSKAVDPSSVSSANFFLSADGGVTALPATRGFASGNTTASLTPTAVLPYGAEFTVTVGAGIVSEFSNPLTNPQSFTFTVREAPAMPALASVAPPGGPPLTPVMISGSGFSSDPQQNAVFFGGVPAVITAVEPDFILTRVPLDVGEGLLDVQVTVGGQTTNPLSFSVFEPTQNGSDEVVVRVPSGSVTRSATVSPDGARLYAVAPEADLIIPIDMEEFTTMPSIPVGDLPWAISGHPDGKLVYVANRMSGDVSVIDTDPESPTFNQAIGSIEVGTQPVDLIVTPDGSRVLVANEESQDLSVIDSDAESASFNYVVNRVPMGSTVKTVTITPDGARIYMGTDDGYILIGAVDYGVVRRVPTGSVVRSVTISPDGALLVMVDTEGGVSVIDIADGSPTEDQVVARVPQGSLVKSATISPDGARLYAVMEEDDVINVYAVVLNSGIGVIGTPNPAPATDLPLLSSLAAGENPQSLVFDPQDPTRFMVPNAGDRTISVFDDEIPVGILGDNGVLTGRVLAGAAGQEIAVSGVRVNVYSGKTGELFLSLISDQEGAFSSALPIGRYTASMVTPLEFASDGEERSVSIVAGQTRTCAWTIEPRTTIPDQRSMAWWKHQLAVALRGWGEASDDATAICGYLDTVADHLATAGTGLDLLYGSPASGECQVKLQAAGESFNFLGDWGIEVRTRQQLMAIQLNLASSRLSVQQAISEDGATVSQALDHIENLLGDGDPENDLEAWKVAQSVNMGRAVLAGAIPPGDQNSFYSPVATRFHLDQNYPNPFNPKCRIRFGLPQAGHVQLKIFDLSGRLVKTLVDENLRVGTYTLVWDGQDNRGQPSASGVYFYKMVAESFIQSKKMLLLK